MLDRTSLLDGQVTYAIERMSDGKRLVAHVDRLRRWPSRPKSTAECIVITSTDEESNDGVEHGTEFAENQRDVDVNLNQKVEEVETTEANSNLFPETPTGTESNDANEAIYCNDD